MIQLQDDLDKTQQEQKPCDPADLFARALERAQQEREIQVMLYELLVEKYGGHPPFPTSLND